MKKSKVESMFLTSYIQGIMDNVPGKLRLTKNRITPHQGHAECERRRTPGTAAYMGGGINYARSGQKS